MKKSLLIGTAALLLLSAQASIHPITVNAFPQVDKPTITSSGNDNSSNRATTPKVLDISGHWAEHSIIQAINKGYVEGYPDGNFLPNKNVSRAEFVKMTISALGIEVQESNGKWYESYVHAAEAAGIYKTGDLEDTNWTQTLTREEMSKMAVRALGIDQVEDKQWMYLATKNGIMSGTAPGELTPKGSTTRAQAITVIERLLSAKKGNKLAVDKYAVAAAEMYWHKTNIFTVAEEIFNSPENEKYKYAKLGINSWSVDKLTVSAPNKSVVGQVNSLTAIDWNDPKDPNRKLLPSKGKLVWEVGGKQRKLTEDMKAYLILLDSKLVVNEKPKSYPINRLSLSIVGYSGEFTGFNQAIALKSLDPKKQIYGLVIPKMNFKTNGELYIFVETMPLNAPLHRNKLSTSALTR
ncbi:MULTISPECIES: S-layer homology domain-containing protein [Paenibacillus]|uniref:S-layer homology domain-containing protein n=1 Tax=Paenibacillus alvei TaxID=44250 RepID=A0ABT4EGN2_PAEAL|nr:MULTISPECIES: S-layer homology domain-containing protein [Paenibacillus]MCY9532780.1 S-layer homology domain-containing protein [Paenibacillus alvei]